MKRNFVIQSVIAVLILLTIGASTKAQNPILKGYADPHMKIWNGKMYISVGKDENPDLKRFSMPFWEIYSSDDLMNWKVERKIMPEETFIGAGSDKCWATDITTRNGKYYFYFSHGGFETGVLIADQPGDPYRDVLKKPMIPENLSVNHEYDPTIFIDDDGSQYIIFGRDGFDGKNHIHYQIAKLSDDMISFAEEPKDLLTDAEFGFGGANRARDHQYFHKHNGIYYLSCAGAYRTSTTIYGPYTNERFTGVNGHASFCEFNGQTYHMYEWTCEPFGVRQYRQVCMTYIHYKDNGDMVDDVNFLQETSESKEGKYYKTGVGNYDANWELIEAEWFFKKNGSLEKKECPSGGFEIQNLRNGDVLNFPNVKNMYDKKVIRFRISSTNKAGATIEIRRGSKTGELMGTCKIPHTGSCTKYEIVSCSLKNTKNPEDFYFVFKGDNEELGSLDWFSFK